LPRYALLRAAAEDGREALEAQAIAAGEGWPQAGGRKYFPQHRS